MTDELTDVGETGAELQSSVGRASHSTNPKRPLAYQGLLEIQRGLADGWEASVQLPVTSVSGTWYASGVNLEVQHIAPHDRERGGYYGLRAELSYGRVLGDPLAWGIEARPILGYRLGQWHGTLNFAVNLALSGQDRRMLLSPSAKLMRQVGDRTTIGLEYYADAGPLSSLALDNRRDQLALIALDTQLNKNEVNFGIGKGITSNSDAWVTKLIVALPFD